jgi:hypothetical protein
MAFSLCSLDKRIHQQNGYNWQEGVEREVEKENQDQISLLKDMLLQQASSRIQRERNYGAFPLWIALRLAIKWPDKADLTEVKLPVETIMLTKGFLAAWDYGMRQWNEAGEGAELFPVRDTWKSYESIGIREPDPGLIYQDCNATLQFYSPEYKRFVAADLKSQAKQIQQQVKAAAVTVEYAPALTNLGTIALIRSSTDAALDYFNRAKRSEPRNPALLAGIGRTLYEQ